MNKSLIYFILIILVFNLNSFCRTKQADALDKWRNLVKQSSFSLKIFDAAEILKIVSLPDSLSGSEIQLIDKRSFNQLIFQIEEAMFLDNILMDKINNSGNLDLIFSAYEYKFHTLIAAQIALSNLFSKMSDNDKFYNIVLYSTCYYECSGTKSKLLYDLLSLLQNPGQTKMKQKVWLTIERMISRLDFKKAESGDKRLQASAYGIFMKPSEIISFLGKVNSFEMNN